MILPVVLIMVLGAVDVARVLSTQQRLENAAHLASLRLLTTPSLNTPAGLASFIQAESGLSPVSAGSSYSLSGDGADQVVVTATYNYPLILPGLRNLQTGFTHNGNFTISVSASGIATTNPPTLTVSSNTYTVQPPTDASAPTGLTLTCSLLQAGSVVATRTPCTPASTLQWTAQPTPGVTHPYSATVTQNNSVTSPASIAVTGP